MTPRRPLIAVHLLALAAVVLAACGESLAVPDPTPSVARSPVLAPTAPVAPTIVPTATAETQPTSAPPTNTPTEIPAGVIQPLSSPVEPALQATEAPGPAGTPEPSSEFEFAYVDLYRCTSPFEQAVTPELFSVQQTDIVLIAANLDRITLLYRFSGSTQFSNRQTNEPARPAAFLGERRRSLEAA